MNNNTVTVVLTVCGVEYPLSIKSHLDPITLNPITTVTATIHGTKEVIGTYGMIEFSESVMPGTPSAAIERELCEQIFNVKYGVTTDDLMAMMPAEKTIEALLAAMAENDVFDLWIREFHEDTLAEELSDDN